MQIWTAELKELEDISESLKGAFADLEKELSRLIKSDDENIVLLYSRRCLEVIITDLCEAELKRPRKTEPLKGIIDKLNREEKVPSHIITSMHSLNSLSTFGAHPKNFDPRQVKPVLNNLALIIEWYIKYKNLVPDIKSEQKQIDTTITSRESDYSSEEQSRREKSIIVLPFDNMSPDPDQEYFSDGLTEEIITDLSYIPGLLVISRNSSMTFKGTRKKTDEIAREVNVRHVLEGSVRKSGNKIRITAQLIDALTDTHIWANKYDGDLDDIFDIQEKVSLSIADSLKIKFSEGTKQQISRKPIKDPMVYEIYLKAKYEDWQFNETSLRKGEELLKQGLKIAGDNELLYAELCHVNVQYVNNLIKDPVIYPELLEEANQYAEKAVRLNPSSAHAYYARGLALYQSCHPKEAIESWQKAISTEPNHSEPMLFLMLGFMYSMTGLDLKEAEALLRKSSIMDPLTPICKTSQGWHLFFEGKFQESIDELAEWQYQLEQIGSPFLIWFVWSHGLAGNFSKAFELIDKIKTTNPEHIMSAFCQFIKYCWQKEKKKALDYLNSTIEKAAWWDDGYSMMMAEGFAMIREFDKAFIWLNRAIDYGITNILFLTQYDHFLENLRKDERFEACIRKAKRIIESLKDF